jgi:hypothetical protein
MSTVFQQILKPFEEYSEFLDFELCLEDSVSETGSVSILRWGKGYAYSFGPLRKN